MTSDSTAVPLPDMVGAESTQPVSVRAPLSSQGPLTASQLFHSAFLNTDSLQQIFHHSPIGMTVIDLDGWFMSANASFCEALGYSVSELMSLSLPDITYGDDIRLLASFNEQLLRGEREHYQIETRHWTQSGNPLYVELTVTMVRDSQVQPSCYLLQVQNLTVHKWMAEQLRHKAFYDCVTGLANRTLFINRLEHALCRLERKPNLCCAVLFLDVDRFKMLNYGLGYAVGDQLLRALGGRLASCLGEGDTLARVGSDEFAILLEEIDVLDDALKVCERIHAHLKSGFKLADHVVLASVSTGLVCSRVGYADASDLLQKADTALTQAKVQGGGYHRVFEPHQHQRAIARWHLATQAQLAVEREELRVHYQPVVNLTSGRVIGVEALVRWHHPQHGEISPTDFIPVLEETGAITQLGDWVLKAACVQLYQWQQQLPATVDLKLSVNISARQLINHDLVSQVSSVLRETGLRPENLQLEITETGIMCDAAATLKRLNALKALNVSLCIDDFGIGYSSLSRLQSFPIDILKIDRTFVSKMGANGVNTEIVRSIIELGERLGMEIVAEGVETALQLAKLRGLGCDNIQGFYIAKPMPSAAAFQFIQTSYQQASYGRRQN